MEELELDPKPKRGPAALLVPLVAVVCLLLYGGGTFEGADRSTGLLVQVQDDADQEASG